MGMRPGRMVRTKCDEPKQLLWLNDAELIEYYEMTFGLL
jgi:hypothetical protein